ncbi:Synaptic vesicle glycoprotein 2B [Liparis tanakae]|uniref:Synaptic vesicle glycoprotein 2B n=1 Tax=Liparis tanakae TaxID=230148 RepID=A0A4Z2HWV9_9TELE|nr:Synaptic vesicle glycoprotein 2B [Liparis tanakae]
MDDPYHNNASQQAAGGGEYAYTQDGGGQDGYPYQADYPPQEEDARSDATEGADDDEQMYEGEYQGVPHPDEIKEARRAARTEARRKARQAVQQEEEDTLPEQYETIMEDCGHGRFQWMLFVVLGLALMADGVDSFVVGFVLPSAEKDMPSVTPGREIAHSSFRLTTRLLG